MTKIESATHIPAHYLLMASAGVFLISLLISLGKSVLFVAVLMLPIVWAFLHDILNKQHEKKWVYYWMCFSIITLYSKLLNLIPFFGYIEVAACYYVVFFDKESLFEGSMNKLVAWVSNQFKKIINSNGHKSD